MYIVHPKKNKANVLTIKINRFARRGKAVHGKGGRHKDKRRNARVNERADVKREW